MAPFCSAPMAPAKAAPPEPATITSNSSVHSEAWALLTVVAPSAVLAAPMPAAFMKLRRETRESVVGMDGFLRWVESA